MKPAKRAAGEHAAMPELAERLTGPGAQAEREAVLARLAGIEARLRQTIGTGLSRPNFVDWQHALTAVAAASATIHHLPPASPGISPSSIEGLFRRAEPCRAHQQTS